MANNRGATVTYIKPEWRAVLLAGLGQGLSVAAAAEAAGMSRTHAYRLRESEPGLADEWAAAVERGRDYLRDVIRRRAVDGVKRRKVTVHRGKVVHVEHYRQFSDALLIRMAEANLPEYRRDDRPVTSGGTQVVIYVPDNGRPVGPALQVVGLPLPGAEQAPEQESSAQSDPGE